MRLLVKCAKRWLVQCPGPVRASAGMSTGSQAHKLATKTVATATAAGPQLDIDNDNKMPVLNQVNMMINLMYVN